MNFFNVEYRNIFEAYSVPFQNNLYTIQCYFGKFSYLLTAWIILYSIIFFRKMGYTIFAILNAVCYFFVFNFTQVICYDHMLIFQFWMLCFVLSAIYTIISSLKNKILQCVFLIFTLSLFSLNFYITMISNNQNLRFFTSKQYLTPYKVPNKEIIKTIEKEIRQNVDKDETYSYSIWAFVNQKFNPQLFFQEDQDFKYFQRGMFPPLVDEEAIIIANCGFMGVMLTNDIYTLDPMKPEYYQQTDSIMARFAEMLKNKKYFGASYKLSSKKYKLKTGENVLKYTRTKPLTKEEQEATKQIFLSWYPWANKYYPDYLNELYKEDRNYSTTQ